MGCYKNQGPGYIFLCIFTNVVIIFATSIQNYCTIMETRASFAGTFRYGFLLLYNSSYKFLSLNIKLFYHLLLLKHVFADTAIGTYPIVGNIFKSCSGLDPIIRIAHLRIINITTYRTYPLFQFKHPFQLFLIYHIHACINNI